MLHIATIHWKDDRWIDVQLKYLHANIKEPFKVYAFLNDLPSKHQTKYFYSSTEPIESHPIKLNLLADIAAFNAGSPDDWLMFIDGDAFPINDILSFGRSKFKDYPLLAIQRKENNNDVLPHPCFCLTTIGFWKDIGGDWKKGPWKSAEGKVSAQPGSTLMSILEEKRLGWYPILRSNKKNLDPVFFGIYEDLIYHHGAGFRTDCSRRTKQDKINESRQSPVYRTLEGIHALLPKRGIFRKIRKQLSPTDRATRQAIMETQRLSDEVFELIKHNFTFYNEFL